MTDDPVLLTGAGGRVGRAILEGIGADHDWRLLDRESIRLDRLPDAVADAERVIGDVTDEATVRDAISGVAAVIHLAGDPRPEAPWDSVVTNNVDGTQTVFAAAAAAGIDRVAFASSNHAVGAYETADLTPGIYRPEDEFRLDGSELPRPSNLYGVSKAAGEALGRYYHDAEDLSVACVRIGNLTEGHPPRNYERGQAMWLSHRDCAHLFDRCLHADYGFEIVYGISANERRYYSIKRAREVLGYDPQDDSAEYHLDGTPKA